jgi:2-methylisocitrate lyase-like PEP mutase family enzyme
MPAQPRHAAIFQSLHADFLILPNAWDAGSARLMQEAGAKAIATSSAAVAWSHGYADGHHLPPALLVKTVEEIARVVSVPITADAEGGYADDPKQVGENISALIGAGAVGINLEDGAALHELHLRKIEAAREAGKRAGVALFINARTDVYLKRLAPPAGVVAETIRRGLACKAAGASGLFAPGVIDPKEIEAIVQGVDLPLNVMARPGLPNAAALQKLGVRRLSAATATFNAAMEGVRAAAAEFLAQGDADALAARTGKPPAWNDLFKN